MPTLARLFRVISQASLSESGLVDSSRLTLDGLAYDEPLPENDHIYEIENVYDGLGRLVSFKQNFNQAKTQWWASGFTPRNKQVDYSYSADALASSTRIEFDGTSQNSATATYAYFADGRARSVVYHSSTSGPVSGSVINSTTTISQAFYGNGQVASISRAITHDSAALKNIDELIQFAYNGSGSLQSQTTSYQPLPNSSTRQPGPVANRDPRFDTTPGGRIAQDDQFTYLYDAEGNLVQRQSKFTAITIDDLDTSRVYTSSTSWFTSQDGEFPLTDSNPQQQYSSGGLLGAGTALAEVTFPEVGEGLYDVWTTWQQRNSLGSGKYEMFVKDDFTRANIPIGFGLGMLQDPETQIFSRTNDSSQNTDIPVNFAVIPRYTHDDNLAWFLVGTVKLDANSTLKLRLQKLSGEIVVDGFKLSPHVAKEVIEYDHANRAIHSMLYSERLSTPRSETYYAYDVVGNLVATRSHDFVEGLTSTTGYGYQGQQQVFSFGMDDPQADYQKIKNFNLIGVQGDVLAFESTRFNSTTLTNEPRTVWQFNNLDGTKFVDDRGWSTSEYAFAGQRHAASNTDYLVQSRDSARRTWSGESEHGSVGYAAVEAFFGSIGGSLSRFGNGLLQLGANAVDTAMIGLNAATTLGGFEWQYRALGATGQAVEANELTTSDIVYNVGAGLGTMALDTVSLGGYATYQYNVGLITAEEAGDRFIGLGLMALGGAGSLRAAGLTKMTVGQAGKVVTNAITHPVSTVKALGGMIQTVVAPVREVVSAAGVRRVPGRLYDAPQRAALKKYLDRNNVDLIEDAAETSFSAKAFGRHELRIRSDATYYEVYHELQHYRHLKGVGYRKFEKTSEALREQYVYDQLRRSDNLWNRVMRQGERDSAFEYILDKGGNPFSTPSSGVPFPDLP